MFKSPSCSSTNLLELSGHSSQQLYKKLSQFGVFRRVITLELSRRRWAASYHTKTTRKNLSLCVVFAGCFRITAARDQRASDNREVGRRTPTEAPSPLRGCTPRSTEAGWRQRIDGPERISLTARHYRYLQLQSLVLKSSRRFVAKKRAFWVVRAFRTLLKQGKLKNLNCDNKKG